MSGRWQGTWQGTCREALTFWQGWIHDQVEMYGKAESWETGEPVPSCPVLDLLPSMAAFPVPSLARADPPSIDEAEVCTTYS